MFMSRAGIETTSGESVGQSGDKGLFEWFAAPKAVATDLFLIEVDFAAHKHLPTLIRCHLPDAHHLSLGLQSLAHGDDLMFDQPMRAAAHARNVYGNYCDVQ
jgi:hypothetical protein